MARAAHLILLKGLLPFQFKLFQLLHSHLKSLFLHHSLVFQLLLLCFCHLNGLLLLQMPFFQFSSLCCLLFQQSAMGIVMLTALKHKLYPCREAKLIFSFLFFFKGKENIVLKKKLGKQGKSYCLLACLQCHASSASSPTATKGYSENVVNNANTQHRAPEETGMHKLSSLS